MDESILTTIKKLLGIDEDYEAFDMDITLHINTVFNILTQLGVKQCKGFEISGDETRWFDLLGNATNLGLVKTYMYMKVRSMFDPPTSSTVNEAMNRTMSELEFRIITETDPGGYL